MRRRGFPSSLQLFKVGNASRLHQHSSSKPIAQVSGLSLATSISRSRLLFSFVQGIWGGDPPLSSHPSHSQKARKRRPDGFSRDAPLGKSLLEGGLGCHLQSPKATLVSELPRRAVQHLPESLGALLVEGVAGPPGARGFPIEGVEGSVVEVVYGVAHRLRGASEV